jgi:plastocyanin
MKGFRAVVTAVVLVALVAATAAATYAARSDGDSKGHGRIAMRDDCDPKDPAWNAVGGCVKKKGNVSAAEFDGELNSLLSAAVIGHQSWRNDPPYLVVKKGTKLKVKNVGGRPHTFTKVSQWGGGVVPPLSGGLQTSPECADMVVVPPGGKAKVSDLTVGNHRFLCCFHPWMRALVKVKEHDRKHGKKHDD